MKPYLNHLSFLNNVSFLVCHPIMHAVALQKDNLLSNAKDLLFKSSLNAGDKDPYPSVNPTEVQYFISDHLDVFVVLNDGEKKIKLAVEAIVCIPPGVPYYFKVKFGYSQGVLHTFDNRKGLVFPKLKEKEIAG